ncbi:MAG: protein kinase [Armatimonadia bacterium]
MIGRKIGGCEILRELGRGGMGLVYEARQESPQRLVALKVLSPQLSGSPDVARRFREEANFMARLDGHPHLAAVYAAGEEDGLAYFVMPLLAGGNLEQRLAAGPMPLPEIVNLGIQMAEALDFAHQRGLVHRDIKPANIMFNTQGLPVLTDFGIAKAADEIRQTMTGMAVCTPEYASPEQVKGNPVDGRSDLYSLGVVLYRMVCGRPVFDSGSAIGLAMKHVSDPPTRPALLRPDIPADLENIILRCLAKEPGERFANGADLAQALRAINWQRIAPQYVPQAPAPAPTVIGQAPYYAPPPPPPPARRVPVAGIAIAALGVMCLLFGVLAFARLNLPPTPPAAAQIADPAAAPGAPPPPPPAVSDPASQAPAAPGAPAAPAPGAPAGALVGPDPPDDSDQSSSGDATASIHATYDRWLSAWQARDLDTYLSCYTSDCKVYRARRSGYQDRAKLAEKMRQDFAKKSWISIDSREPEIELHDNWAKVRAYQEYDSNTWRDTGTKSLTFKLVNGEWLISSEAFTQESGGKK